MTLDRPIIDTLPPPRAVRHRLGDLLREVALLRRLLRLTERAEEYRRSDRHVRTQEEDHRHDD